MRGFVKRYWHKRTGGMLVGIGSILAFVQTCGPLKLHIPSSSPSHLLISPEEAVDMGTALIGVSGPQAEFTIKNTGEVASGNISITLLNSTDFSIASNNCTDLAPSATCRVVVRFTPTVPPGSKSTTLMVSTPTGGERAATVLSGMAINLGLLTATITEHDFDSERVGSTSPGFLVTIQNGAGRATGKLSVALEGPNADQFDVPSATDSCNGGALSAGGKCQLSVRFRPLASGGKSAQLVVRDTASQVVAVKLTGRARALLTLTFAGNGTGTVADVGKLISCTVGCNGEFEGDELTLAATASATSRFAGWAGDCTGTGQCKLTMSANRNVIATFNAAALVYLSIGFAADPTQSQNLVVKKVTSSPPGIDCGYPLLPRDTCSFQFAAGTALTLEIRTGSVVDTLNQVIYKTRLDSVDFCGPLTPIVPCDSTQFVECKSCRLTLNSGTSATGRYHIQSVFY